MAAIAVLVVALAPAGGAAATALPDLTVSKVTAPGWADPGGSVLLSVTVADAQGAAAAPKSALTAFLSQDRRLGSGDVSLHATVPTPRIASAHHVLLHPDLVVPSAVKPGQYWVIACADGAHAVRESNERNNCAPSSSRVQVTAQPMTSVRLIDAALAAHQLTRSQAVVDKVLAAVGDPRLPARFRGDDGTFTGDLALRDANAAWPSLSGTQRQVVAPFLQGPAGPHGWPVNTGAAVPQAAESVSCPHKGPTDMNHIDAANGRVRIWWPAKGLPNVAAAAPRMARQVTAIWKSYVALMRIQPPSDANFCGYNGGDGHYDIYLCNGVGDFFHGYAVTVSYKGYGAKRAPAFTMFNTWADDPPTGWALAHELFHTFQFAYDKASPPDSYDGFDEGAANWAANWMYPSDDEEHVDDEMLTWPQSSTFPDNSFGYELWTFDLYLTEKYGDDLMRQIYVQFEHQPELQALNSVIPGGFADAMPEFARYGWNQTPVQGGFRAWDHLDSVPWKAYQQPLQPMNLHLGTLEQRTLNLPAKLPQLTRTYYPLHVDDNHIKDLYFDNTFHGVPGASVQAFVKLANGKWQTQNWTNRKSVDFCFSETGQHVTDLVVLYANANYGSTNPLPSADQPRLLIRNNCDRYYRVTAVSGSYTENISVTDTAHSYTCTDSGTEQYSVSYDPSARPNGTLTDGMYTPGGIGFSYVPAGNSGSDHYSQSCQNGPVFRQPCDATISGETEYLMNIGTIENTSDNVPIQVEALHHDGDQYSDNSCDSNYGYGNADTVQWMDAGTVSKSTLEGTAPFTVTGSNTFNDQHGHTFTRTITVTLQPTDKNGNPLQ